MNKNKRSFKIKNLKRTFLTIPLKTKSIALCSMSESDVWFPETEMTPGIKRFEKMGYIVLEWREETVKIDSPVGRVKIEKTDKDG